MTLVAAWVRQYASHQELYVASDSRLNGGRAWDIGSKIFDLGRGDSLIAFAGDTADAYPLMQQLQTAIKMHPQLLDRSIDLTELKGHVLRIFNSMWESITSLPVGIDQPDPAQARFIFAGYSWRLESFKIWELNFNKSSGTFVLREASMHRKRLGGNKYFSFIGDNVKKAKYCVYEKLRNTNRMRAKGLAMEPFEVLVEFIRDQSMPSIGGPPQIYKVYRHLNTLPYNIYWPNKAARTIAFGGRILLPYERNKFLAFDADTHEVATPEWPV